MCGAVRPHRPLLFFCPVVGRFFKPSLSYRTDWKSVLLRRSMPAVRAGQPASGPSSHLRVAGESSGPATGSCPAAAQLTGMSGWPGPPPGCERVPDPALDGENDRPRFRGDEAGRLVVDHSGSSEGGSAEREVGWARGSHGWGISADGAGGRRAPARAPTARPRERRHRRRKTACHLRSSGTEDMRSHCRG